jgi:hypothetical protein
MRWASQRDLKTGLCHVGSVFPRILWFLKNNCLGGLLWNALLTRAEGREGLTIVAVTAFVVLGPMARIDFDKVVKCFFALLASALVVVWLVKTEPQINFPTEVLAPNGGGRGGQVETHLLLVCLVAGVLCGYVVVRVDGNRGSNCLVYFFYGYLRLFEISIFYIVN